VVNSGISNAVFVSYHKTGMPVGSDTELCAWTNLLVWAELFNFLMIFFKLLFQHCFCWQTSETDYIRELPEHKAVR